MPTGRPVLAALLLALACLLRASRLASGQYFCSSSSANATTSGQFRQHNNHLQFHVAEDAAANTLVGLICSSEGQIPSYILTVKDKTSEKELYAAFSFNLTTGELFTAGPLDREQREQYFFLGVVGSPFLEIKVSVTVTDVNDNAPAWLYHSVPSSASLLALAPNASQLEQPAFVVDIPEGQRGMRFRLPVATDADSLKFGIKEFRIVSSNTREDAFQLVESDSPSRPSAPAPAGAAPSGAQTVEQQAANLLAAENPSLVQQIAQQANVLIPGSPVTESSPSGGSTRKWHIELEVNQILDRENQSSYQLIIEALDGGQPPRLGRLMVEVNVQDVNDNEPVFTQELYECRFKEDSAKGTPIVRVQAHDSDLGANAHITYHIKKHSSPSQKGNLIAISNSSDSLGADTGALTPSRHSAGKQRQQSLTPSNPKQPARQSSEAHEPTDGHKTKVSPVLHSSAGEHWSLPFEIDPVKGEIYLSGSLDFEADQVHELLVEAKDNGKPSRSGYATVRVHVLDVADDPPLSSAGNKHPDDAARDRSRLTGAQAPTSEASKSDVPARGYVGPSVEADVGSVFGYLTFSLSSWSAQINSPLLFVIVFVCFLLVALSVCLVKTKSNQPEGDYTDTAGLTLTSNNGQTKSSPNHSGSNHDHSTGASGQLSHHRHHSEHPSSRLNVRTNGSFSGSPFATSAAGKLRAHHQYMDSTNVYHNLFSPLHQHQHHSQHQHRQQQQQLEQQHCQQQQLDQLHQFRYLQQLQQQAPSVPDSPVRRQMAPGALAGIQSPSGGSQSASAGNLDSAATTLARPALLASPASPSDCVERWLELGACSQLAYAHDCLGAYNWDYLADWAPDYHSIVPLIEADARVC